MTISISNHPIDDNILREASYSGHDVQNDPEYGFSVKLRLRVNHYIMVDGVKTNHPLQAVKWVTLTADKSTFVDAQGNIVPEEDSVMTEFDFFIMLMGVSIIQNDIISAKILWADSLGRFD